MTEHSDRHQNAMLYSAPDGRLGIIPLKSAEEMGQKVDAYLTSWRRERVEKGEASADNGYSRDTFLIDASTPRFGTGEAKGSIGKSIRGDDLYILVDVCNHSLTYRINGFENVMSPDDHFQDVKRVIAAANGKAHRLTVIMPYLYEGRMLVRDKRESIDCASALQELVDLGVENIITFDAHDARVQNSIPLSGFETVSPAYQFIKNILRYEPDLIVDDDHLMCVSPDEGGMGRAIYLANVLGINMGMFYKRRDYTKTVKGSHPILAHEFLGTKVEGKDIIIIDDMISSGQSVLETAQLLKSRGANRIFICATFGMFTNGIEKFDEAYRKGLFHRLITTNLIYQSEEVSLRRIRKDATADAPGEVESEQNNIPKYYICCDMSKYIALIIDTLNADGSLSSLLNPVDRIKKVVAKHRNHEKI